MMKNEHFILQGHRGCTGYYPENSIEGFIYALEIGVNALEIDVVVSKDNQLIVSHDPFFRSDICLDPYGNRISKKEEKQHNIYAKTIVEIKKYTCINNPLHTDQISLTHTKPTLLELINSLKQYCEEKKIKLPRLTIEIKSNKNWEGQFQPNIKNYVSLINQFDKSWLSGFDVLYHSFDIRILRGLSKIGYTKLDFLIEENNFDITNFLSSMDFKLSGLGIYYKLINKEIISALELEKLTLSAWTVNSVIDLKKLLELGISNIITDYPIMAKEVLEEFGIVIV